MTHQTRRRFPWLCLLMLSWMTAEVQAAAVTDPQIGLNFIRFSWVSRRGALGPARADGGVRRGLPRRLAGGPGRASMAPLGAAY